MQQIHQNFFGCDERKNVSQEALIPSMAWMVAKAGRITVLKKRQRRLGLSGNDGICAIFMRFSWAVFSTFHSMILYFYGCLMVVSIQNPAASFACAHFQTRSSEGATLAVQVLKNLHPFGCSCRCKTKSTSKKPTTSPYKPCALQESRWAKPSAIVNMDLSGNFTGQEQQEHVVAKKLGKQTTLNIDHKIGYIVFFVF